MSRVETETQAGAVPGDAPDIGESPNGFDPTQLPADIERIDLSDPEYREHAFERYEEMRARCPVSRAIITSGQGGADEQAIFNRPLWLVTDYEEGSRALLDRAITVEMTSVLTPEQLAQMPETPPEFQPLMRNILNVDPPEHTRLRKLVQPSFTASAIEKLRPRIQQIVDDLLDAAETVAAERGERAPDRQMELISQFSYPLPITVICDMLGIPPQDREQTRHWSENLLSAQSPERMEEIRRNIGEFITYLRDLFARKRETPEDDLISQLLQVEVEGDRLTEDEVLAMVFILFVAGHITTVNLIANGVFALLTNPEQAAKLRSDPGLVSNAVEEVLRYYGPAETTTPRFAGEDVELGGQAIAKGDPLLVVLAAADRDPARFADPQAFDITRGDANRHIAFGKGIHACLGAPLARLEGQVALSTLFRRYPDLRLAVPESEITWAPSFLRSLTALPLLF
ncbi:MAG: cytochrome hydroxylase [Thermomicrobiales bacterium]|nr:cytochrome hydroxylase [Thermomicrobiales bacterium]